MIERIRQLYIRREQRLLPVPWCDDPSFNWNKIFTKLRIVGKDKTTGIMKDDITNMTGIYKTHEECEEPPRTVLIEGDLGMGKTTYCQKLAYDWATSREHWDKSFPMIDLLLLLRCHDIKSNLWEAIDEQLLPDNIDEKSKHNLFKFIRENQSRVLFVLDGIDKADHGAIDMFINLAQSKELPKCFFVFTSRHESGMKIRPYCDNLWEVVGFTQGDAKEFIHKYFRNRKDLANRLLEEIGSSSDLSEVITNPLNTALLCILCEYYGDAFPKSKTQLYIEIVKCVLRRYEEKEVFSSNDEDIIKVYEEELRSLGRIALESLLKDELYIEESKVNANNFKSVKKFGFLSVQSGGIERKPCFRYSFLHKSFQEFFAGFHLALSYLREEDEDIDIEITDQKFLYELHQVFLYVCGVVAMQSEETAKRLLGKITVCVDMSVANFKEVVGNMKLAFCLIEECGKCKESLQFQLLQEFGVRLPLQACTLGMITRLDFFLESLSFNKSLTHLDLHLSPFRTMFSRAKIDKKEIYQLYRALTVNTKLTHLNLSGNEIDASGAKFLSRALLDNSTLTHLNLDDNLVRACGAAYLSLTTLTYLNLDGNLVGAFGIKSLSSALSLNTTALTDLNLARNEIDDSGAESLSKALSDNTTLTHLNLSGNEIGAPGATYLSRALLANTTLTDLNLSNNKIDTSGATSLFQDLSRNTTLTHLNLSKNNIENSNALSFFEDLSDNTTLTNLNLSGNNIGVSAAPLQSVSHSHNVRLTHLNLSHNSIDDGGASHLSRALSRNTALTHLNLSGNEIGAPGAASLFEVLSDNTTLTHLNLSHNGIDDGGACHLSRALSRNTTLTHLDLSHSSIDDGGARRLSRALSRNTTLTHLNLSHSSIDDGGARHLSRVLSRNTALTHLNLSGNKIGAPGAVSLFEVLSDNTTLTNLNLSGNNISVFADPIPSVFFLYNLRLTHLRHHHDSFLSRNTTLTHLNLSHNSIGYDSAIYLSKILLYNTSLTHLNLSHNSIDDGGACHLFAALFSNTTLTDLNLSHSSIGDDGACSLFVALSMNTTLTHLNLSHCSIDDGGALHLSWALSRNTALTHLNLSGNNIGYSGAVSLSPFQSILYWLI